MSVCVVCSTKVYPQEKVNGLEGDVHKKCFKCSFCQASLTLKNYKKVTGVLYCNTHANPGARLTGGAPAGGMDAPSDAPAQTEDS